MTVEELKKLWAPEAQGKVKTWSQVRAGWPDRKSPPVRRRRRLGHLRLLHRGDRRQGALEPRRLHLERGRQRARAGHRHATSCALGFFGFAYYEENKDKLKLVPIDDGKRRQRRRRHRPVHRDRRERHLPAAVASHLHLRRASAAAERKEVQDFVELLPRNGHQARRTRSATSRCPPTAYELAQERFAEAQRPARSLRRQGSQGRRHRRASCSQGSERTQMLAAVRTQARARAIARARRRAAPRASASIERCCSRARPALGR